MLSFLKNILGIKTTDFARLITEGAIIIDVRTKGEFVSGHIEKSLNIPLDQLQEGTKKLKKDKPVITCCASGMRSAAARNILKSQGFEVYNGGSWYRLNRFILK